MEFSNIMTGSERVQLDRDVESYNKSLHENKMPTQELGRDDFLKLLITQLENQDPTSPMEDREFIAQMAQFSTLEQMNNISREFGDLTHLLSSGQAVALLGRDVEILQGETVIEGKVQEITGGSHPRLLVNGSYYDYSDVSRIKN
jgi:flagellar basal-body rod modification protein FlgD